MFIKKLTNQNRSLKLYEKFETQSGVLDSSTNSVCTSDSIFTLARNAPDPRCSFLFDFDCYSFRLGTMNHFTGS